MLPTMKTTIAIILLPSTLPFILAAPAFPPPAELTQGELNSNITLIAGGGLPNSSASPLVGTSAAITGLQLLASLENIEAFYYSEAIKNITTGVYSTGDVLLKDTLEIIEKIAAVCLSSAL
jgi:hypothetical protein